MLGLLRRVFSSSMAESAKRSLYISLVRSQLLYCSPVWHPYLLADVKCLELLQRRATKFIVNDTSMDYRNRLIHLKLLPLMMELEIADIIFFIKSVRYTSDHFDFVQFSAHHTCSSSNFKLKHTVSRNYNEKIFYFNRIPPLWDSLPPLDISLHLSSIKSKLHNYFWDHFISHFNPNNECSYHYLCLCYKCSSLPVNMHFSSNSL
jgi:hypothetical protein